MLDTSWEVISDVSIQQPIKFNEYKRQSKGTLFTILCYGDYPPASRNVVETIFIGEEHVSAIESLRRWSFNGGAPIRNALHEGIAGVLESLDKLKRSDSWQHISLAVITTTLIYEEFHSYVQVRSFKRYLGKSVEDLLRELQQKKVILYYFSPSPDMAKAFVSILERVYNEKELKIPTSNVPTAWAARIAIPEGHNTTRGGSGDSVDGLIAAEPRPTMHSNQSALETAVRQYLTAVLKLPQNKRAEAIKQHLESPAYSADYKQCMISMVKQMQNQAKPGNGTGVTVTTTSRNTTERSLPSPILPSNIQRPTTAPSLPIVNRPAIWNGRLAFRHCHLESSFDVAACPIPNPKSQLPQTIPLIAEYHVDSWPLVLAISSFVPVQSPAVINSVAISKLVELVAWSKDSSTAAANNDIANGFRNLLISRRLVGLVRLGSNQAILVAARPHQLVGMIVSRQDAVSISSQSSTISTFAETAPVITLVNEQQSVRFPTPTIPSNTLTPEAILRQHRPGTASLPSVVPISGSSTDKLDTVDVFNALLHAHSMNLDDAKQVDPLMDLTDFTYSPAKKDSSQDSLFFDF